MSAAEGLAALIVDIGRNGKRGWKQALAKRMGVSPGYLSKFLSAPYPNLSEQTARQIEMRLGLRPGALESGACADDVRFMPDIDPIEHAMRAFDALSVAAREAFLAWARTR